MSNATSQSTITPQINGIEGHGRAMSMSGGLNSGFTMPLKTHRASSSNASISGLPNSGGLNGLSGARGHQRTGSASKWAQQGFGGGGGGVLNFAMPAASSAPRLPATSSAPRLATHSEASSADPSRSSSASGSDPILVMDSALPRTGTLPAANAGGRRESISADKALNEVRQALASVSVGAQG